MNGLQHGFSDSRLSCMVTAQGLLTLMTSLSRRDRLVWVGLGGRLRRIIIILTSMPKEHRLGFRPCSLIKIFWPLALQFLELIDGRLSVIGKNYGGGLTIHEIVTCSFPETSECIWGIYGPIWLRIPRWSLWGTKWQHCLRYWNRRSHFINFRGSLVGFSPQGKIWFRQR